MHGGMKRGLVYHKPALLAALLFSVAFAGCVGDDGNSADSIINPHTGKPILPPELRENLTQPLYEIAGHYDTTFEGQTGTQLYLDWYLPTVPEGTKVPTILVFTPYQSARPEEGGVPTTGAPNVTVPAITNPVTGANITNEMTSNPDDLIEDTPYWTSLVNDYVSYGYAVAFADVRGTHRAGGCTDQTGPDQWTDGYDYVEFLAAQEWSNGNVGMKGVSYDGETQTTTAFRQPPSLKTIVPVAAVSSQYEWLIYQGVPFELGPAVGMAGYAMGSAEPSYAPSDAQHYPEKFECQDEAFTDGSDTSGDYTAFWERIDYRPFAGEIDVPVLFIQGFDDYVVRSHQATPFFDNIESEKRGIFGQWTHSNPNREDWADIEHAWYDHHLLGIENGIMDILPPVLAEDNKDNWWGLEEYPASEPEWLELELSADGNLVAPGTAMEGEAVIHDYTTEYFVSSAGSFFGIPLGTAVAAPAIQTIGTEATGHPTHVEFTFTPSEDMVMYGRPELTFTATASAESTHWVALLDNGTNMGEPCMDSSAPYRDCVNYGYQDTRHRNGLDNPQDLTPGESYELTVLFSTQFEVLEAGVKHTLILTNNNPDIQQDPTNSENRILLGADNPAVLRIPLMPVDALPLPADELPATYPGYLPPTEE